MWQITVKVTTDVNVYKATVQIPGIICTCTLTNVLYILGCLPFVKIVCLTPFLIVVFQS